MNRLTPGDLQHVVGVIDLLEGVAVHAVAGDRKRYQPVACCNGDPLQLVSHYRSLGVTAFYIADLTSIERQDPQWHVTESIAAAVGAQTIWLDVGWRSSESADLVSGIKSHSESIPNAQFIAATESCRCIEALSELSELIGPERTWLGLDYRHGELLGCEADEKNWIESAQRMKITGTVILELAAVGTGTGAATEPICTRIKKAAPQMRILSGGGVRGPDDMNRLIAAGCERVLIATALID